MKTKAISRPPMAVSGKVSGPSVNACDDDGGCAGLTSGRGVAVGTGVFWSVGGTVGVGARAVVVNTCVAETARVAASISVCLSPSSPVV
jgi:hypothetical protein